MNIKCIFSKGKNDSFINDVLALDALSYPDYILGSFKSVSERYHKNTDSYILAYKDDSTLIGYICFFPVTDSIFEKMMTTSKMVDDDLTFDDVEVYRKNNKNNILIISIVISPEYRDGNTIKEISKSLADYIENKINEGYEISSFVGSTVSEDGFKVLSRWGFKKIKDLEDGYQLMICEKDQVGEMIKVLRGDDGIGKK